MAGLAQWFKSLRDVQTGPTGRPLLTDCNSGLTSSINWVQIPSPDPPPLPVGAFETMVKSVSDWVTLAFDRPSARAIVFGVPIKDMDITGNSLNSHLEDVFSSKSGTDDNLLGHTKDITLIPSITEEMKYEPPVLESAAGPHTVINGKDVVNFTSADYLGLLGHDKLQESCTKALEKYGVGSCGPRGFYGTIDVHLDCEARIASFLELLILYFIPMDFPQCLVPFQHFNSGQIAPLDEIVKLREKYRFRVILDESNSIGVLGSSGRGLTEHCKVPIENVDIVTAAMGHALATEGGFCTGSARVIDHQRLSSSGYVFSASLPPYLASAAITAIDVLEGNPNLITKLKENIATLRKGLLDVQGLEIVSDPESPIVFLTLKKSTGSIKGDLQVLQDIGDYLLKEHSIFVATSKRSTVDKCKLPAGIRLYVSAAHT
ncbi:hypothetical protein DH2020_011075 [Rehmannia glutinosa]|uniref:serine C-palmitoyltransferase n=1 Tax=Rehmannia glutinosa TaxID=99300 RepID=A0ABR0XCB5_REHGL